MKFGIIPVIRFLSLIISSLIFYCSEIHALEYFSSAGVEPAVLYGNKTGATLWAETIQPDGAFIAKVWAEIYPPPPESMVKVDLGKIGNDRYEYQYENFTRFSSYVIWFFAQDSNNTVSGPVICSLKKQEPAADEHEDDDTFSRAKTIFTEGSEHIHNFHDKGDTDWKKFFACSDLIYTVEVINDDITNTQIGIYDQDGVTILSENQQGKTFSDWTCPPDRDGIYFVKLYNFNPDHYGPTFSYRVKITIKSADDRGIVKGKVTETAYGKPVAGATVTSSGTGGSGTDENGDYGFSESPSPMPYIITAKAQGYEEYRSSVTVPEKNIITQNICLNPLGSKGNVNGDATVDLKDAVRALQILAGYTEFSDKIYKSADVNCDGYISLEEVIYILRKTGGLTVY